MNAGRFLFAVYCDDVRQEVGNKLSLIGCYMDDLIVDALPAALPKLCVQARALTPNAKPFERLVFRAYMNKTLLGELEVAREALERTAAAAQGRAISERHGALAVMTFSPFLIDGPGQLKVEAETEEGLLKGSVLQISVRQDAPSKPGGTQPPAKRARRRAK